MNSYSCDVNTTPRTTTATSTGRRQLQRRHCHYYFDSHAESPSSKDRSFRRTHQFIRCSVVRVILSVILTVRMLHHSHQKAAPNLATNLDKSKHPYLCFGIRVFWCSYFGVRVFCRSKFSCFALNTTLEHHARTQRTLSSIR